MLQQILRDMYVDPEILAELPEEQKEMLFYKIRQEQVRRYKENESNLSKKKIRKHQSTKTEKKVRILEDSEGNPWTWVFGEKEGELTVEKKWQRMLEERMNDAVKAVVEEENERIQKAQCRSRSPSHINGAKSRFLNIKQKATNRRSPSTSPSTSPNVTPVLKRAIQITSSPSQSPVIKRKEMKKALSLSNSNNNNQNNNNTGGAVQIVNVKSSHSPGRRRRDEVFHTQVIQEDSDCADAFQKDQIDTSSDKSSTLNISGTLTTANDSQRPPKLSSTNISEEKSLFSPSVASTEPKDKEIMLENDPVYESFNIKPANYEDVISNEEWERQLCRFKEEDERRSSLARRTSVEIRRQSRLIINTSKLKTVDEAFEHMTTSDSPKQHARPTIPPKPSALRIKHPLTREGKANKPRDRQEVIEWFQETQSAAFDLRDVKQVPEWFHGIITRQEAESLLQNKKKGSFLIRVSDKIWGFALSYRDESRVKHFLIDASEEKCYHFFGNDQIRYETLEELLHYHEDEPISYNGEKLIHCSGQMDQKKVDYTELISMDEDTRF